MITKAARIDRWRTPEGRLRADDVLSRRYSGTEVDVHVLGATACAWASPEACPTMPSSR